jgi:RNA polymerase sigma factor (sigma-70 family)
MREHLASPPLWISKTDKKGNEVVREVIEAAHQIWNRALQYLRREGMDVAPAAEILEETCHCVSRAIRRHRDPNHIRDLESYLFWAFVRKYNRRRALEERIRYVESVQSILDRKERSDRSWVSMLQDKVLFEQFLGHLDAKARMMVICRLRGDSWAEIGRLFGISAHNAEVQYFNAIKKARRRLFGLD